MLIERDQMGLGENVTLTCWKICDAVIQSNRFQPHPRIVAPSHNFKGQTSNVGLKSLKLKRLRWRDCTQKFYFRHNLFYSRGRLVQWMNIGLLTTHDEGSEFSSVKRKNLFT